MAPKYEEEVFDFVQTSGSLRSILDPIEYIITVDQRSIWRRHLAWAFDDGGDLRSHLIQRYSANQVFMSLMLSAELMVLFNSSRETSDIRQAMRSCDYYELYFWIGIIIMVSAFLTLFTLTANFTAWGIVSSISSSNAHCILRSSIGQYAAQLPSRLLVASLYSFLIWLSLCVIALLPVFVSVGFLLPIAVLLLHVVSVYSSLGRLIIHTGGMGKKRIFEETFEKALLPSGLTRSLVYKAIESLSDRRLTATQQYRGGSIAKMHATISSPLGTKKVYTGASEKTVPMQPIIQPPGSTGLQHRLEDPLGSSVHSDESERIRYTVRAMFGTPQRSENEKHTDAPPDQRGEAQMHLRGMPTDSVDPFESDRPERSGNSLDTGPMRIAGDSGVSTAKENIRADERRHGEPPFRLKRGHRRQRAIAELEHETLARLIFGAPPAATDSGEVVDEADRERDYTNLRRASAINKAVLGIRPRRSWWNRSEEQTANAFGVALKNVNEQPFVDNATLESERLLEGIVSGGSYTRDEEMQHFEFFLQRDVGMDDSAS